MKKRLMLIGFGLFVGLIALYALFCLGLRQWQTRLVFFPDAQLKSTPESLGLAYDEIMLPVGHGTHQGVVHGWWIPADKADHDSDRNELDTEAGQNTPVVLYLHGNGSNLGDLIEMVERFHGLKWNGLFIDYRGYGLSRGSFPAEDRVYEDAVAAWAYLVEGRNIPPDRIVVYGHSLGGAIAIELATRQPQMAGVIVEGSFTSMLDMAKRETRYQLVPLNWILTQRFESLEKVRSLRPSLLFLHGTADETIPYSMSQRLYQAAHDRHDLSDYPNDHPNDHPRDYQRSSRAQTLVLIPEAGHNDLPEVGQQIYTQAIHEFVEEVTNAPMSSASFSSP